MSQLVAYDTKDVCVDLDTEVAVPNLLGILNVVEVIGQLIFKFKFESSSFPERLIGQCLCQVETSIFLETYFVGILAVAISGEPTTRRSGKTGMWSTVSAGPYRPHLFN